MKIFMHWDMEGVSGLSTREHVWFWEEGVREHIAEEGRQLLIADMNSAAAAALEAGADELIVCDTHHGGGNIRLDEMPSDPRIRYLERPRGYDGEVGTTTWTPPRGTMYRWMPGLDETVDGLMLMGHHAKAGTANAFLPHTWMGGWADFRINGRSVGEMGIEACFAGHWDVPPILAQGDEAACREAEEQFPGIVTAAVKRAESPDRCAGPHEGQVPQGGSYRTWDAAAARELTAAKVREAVAKARTRDIHPYGPALPMTVTVRMHETAAAEEAARKGGAERVDACTVQGVVDRRCDVVKWILGTGLDMAAED